VDIPSNIQDEILRVIVAKFDDGIVDDIVIDSIRVDERSAEIIIKIVLTTTAEPARLAEGYFGMTGSVRKALGSKWSEFFPIITPILGRETHA